MKVRIFYLFFVFILCCGFAVPAMSADCQGIKKGLRKERNLKKKRKMLADAIIQCPDDAGINYKYALSLERYRKYDKALGHYQKAVVLKPNMGKAHAGMGDVYIYLGRLNEAINSYRVAARLMPENNRTKNRLERLEIKRKALEGGVVTVGEFIRVMDSRRKISSNMPLLLTGPALQYRIAFGANPDKLLPTGIRQLAATGQAMQNDALSGVRFEISTYVGTQLSSLAAMEESKVRAKMIKDRLVTNFLIDPKRLEIVWYGDTQPLEAAVAGGNLLDERVEFKRIIE